MVTGKYDNGGLIKIMPGLCEVFNLWLPTMYVLGLVLFNITIIETNWWWTWHMVDKHGHIEANIS